jgi:LysM repeat protein
MTNKKKEESQMKKRLARSLALLLMMSLVLVSAIPSFAADTVTSASPAWEDGTTPVVTPAPTTAPAPTVKGDVYVVKAGDAFWKIATMYKLTVKQLTALNPQIKNINMIYVGQKITVNSTAITPVVVCPQSLFQNFKLV